MDKLRVCRLNLVSMRTFSQQLCGMSLGNYEPRRRQNIWRIYVSPVSAKNFVKSKFAFMLVFSLVVLPITAAVGYAIYHPTLRATFALVIEALFIAFAAGSLSLANGIKGADFNEVPNPRMIRSEWSLINMVCCIEPTSPYPAALPSCQQVKPGY
jgi:hypothetical protein